MRKKESQLQQSCVEWFRFSFPQFKQLLFAIPNGGKRNIITAMTMKREGVVAGVPDLFLSIPRNEFHGFYIEMKHGKNTLTEQQELFFNSAKKNNYKCEVITSLDQFIREVTYYINSNKN
jgi:hypothetical protein